jgi:hypothetical protein
MNPTVFNSNGVQAMIFFNDHNNVPHVHAFVGGHTAKFIFSGQVRLWENINMTESEIAKAIEAIRSHKGLCWKVWHDRP